MRRNSQLVEQMAERVDVGQPRQVGERQLLLGEERARHQGKGRILGPADRDFAVQGPAALDPDAVHGAGFSAWVPSDKLASLRGAEGDAAIQGCRWIASLRSP